MASSNALRAPFFDSAFEILGEEGYGGLKLAALCRVMGVTTGAFYHSFDSWKDFTTQLLHHWHEERTVRLVELAQRHPDPMDQLESMLQAAITLPHRAEAAIRVWSTLDPDVALLQGSVDHDRFLVAQKAFLALVGDPDEAEKLSRTGLYLLIGFEQAIEVRDLQSLEWAFRLLKETAATRATDARPAAERSTR